MKIEYVHHPSCVNELCESTGREFKAVTFEDREKFGAVRFELCPKCLWRFTGLLVKGGYGPFDDQTE